MAEKRGSILIIEDEEVLTQVLSKKLKARGYSVKNAPDGEEGLLILRQGGIDLVLLDMMMPKMTGYEVLEKIKAENISVPVIIISNSGQPVDIEKAMALGASDYIVKAELDPEEIAGKVKKALSGDKTNDLSEEEKKLHKSGKKVILVAEDDLFLRELCVKKLARVGYQVAEAIDGVQAYEKIVGLKPDLVLLDIIMPGLEGFEILRRVRAHQSPDVAATPIIIFSNLGQDADRKKGLELGASDYLIKSNFTIDEIVKKIEALMK
jgi:DNA-binding response OmpR family regulator